MKAGAQQATIRLPSDTCADIERGLFGITQQNIEASLQDGKLCKGAAPLMRIHWEDRLTVSFAGALTAPKGSYRVARSRFVGAPPEIEFNGIYQPSRNLTEISGDARGGAMLMNNLLKFSNVDGRFTFELNKRVLDISSEVASVRIAQNNPAPRMAPVIGSGDLRLFGGKTAFAYVLTTPRGDRLGTGEGIHDNAKGLGRYKI